MQVTARRATMLLLALAMGTGMASQASADDEQDMGYYQAPPANNTAPVTRHYHLPFGQNSGSSFQLPSRNNYQPSGGWNNTIPMHDAGSADNSGGYSLENSRGGTGLGRGFWGSNRGEGIKTNSQYEQGFRERYREMMEN